MSASVAAAAPVEEAAQSGDVVRVLCTVVVALARLHPWTLSRPPGVRGDLVRVRVSDVTGSFRSGTGCVWSVCWLSPRWHVFPDVLLQQVTPWDVAASDGTGGVDYDKLIRDFGSQRIEPVRTTQACVEPHSQCCVGRPRVASALPASIDDVGLLVYKR